MRVWVSGCGIVLKVVYVTEICALEDVVLEAQRRGSGARQVWRKRWVTAHSMQVNDPPLHTRTKGSPMERHGLFGLAEPDM